MVCQVRHRVSLHPISIQLFDSSDEVYNKYLGGTMDIDIIRSPVCRIIQIEKYTKVSDAQTCVLNNV